MATYFDLRIAANFEENLDAATSEGVQFATVPFKEALRHFHMHFTSSAEKKTILLHQFQALKERLESDSKNRHPYQGKFLKRQTVEMFKTMCDKLELGANHVIRLKALETYDRFMAILNWDIMMSARSHKYSPEDVASINERIETQTLLRICSCIQLAYKFHNDIHDPVRLFRDMCVDIRLSSCEQNFVTQPLCIKYCKRIKMSLPFQFYGVAIFHSHGESRISHVGNATDQVLTIRNIQNVLKYYSMSFDTMAIKRSENRVYKTLSFNLNFVTTLDIIEHIIPLTNTHIGDTPKIYHLCIKILDFVYLAHDQIYKIVKDQKIFIGDSPESNQSTEFNLILRSAGILACAFCLFWPNSHHEKARLIAEICCIPEHKILDFSSIIFNELILN